MEGGSCVGGEGLSRGGGLATVDVLVGVVCAGGEVAGQDFDVGFLGVGFVEELAFWGGCY